MPAGRRMQTDLYLSPSTKLKSKWIKNLNIKPDTLNVIEDKIGNSLEYLVLGKISWIQNTNGLGSMIKIYKELKKLDSKNPK